MIADVYIHSDLPALVRVFGSDFKLVEHAIAVNEEDEIILDAQTDKMYYVIDLCDLQISLGDMIRGANMASHQFKNYRHENVIENLMIVPHHLYKATAQSLDSSILGSVRLKIYSNRADALSYIHQQTVSDQAYL